MQSLFAVVLFATTAVNCLNQVIVNKNIFVTNNEWPNFSTKSDNWVITNKQTGGAVLLDCNVHFKGFNKNCSSAVLTITDGIRNKEICRNQTGYRLHSELNAAAIEMKINEGGGLLFQCNITAMDYGRPDIASLPTNAMAQTNLLKPVKEEIRLTKGRVYRIIKGNLTTNMNYKYSFRCGKDESIDLRCTMKAQVYPQPSNKCSGFRFYVSSWVSNRIQCETDLAFNFIGQSDKLEVLVTTGADSIIGEVDCKVKAIDALKHSFYKTVDSEEVDSSEHGVKHIAGKKETTCACGWSNKETRRVLFGKDTGKHEFPWSVSLQSKSSKKHFCGGSIISPYHVITAAHCVKGVFPLNVLVVMGTNDRTDRQISSDVTHIVHHDYNSKTFVNDIAILALAKKIEFTESVGPVCIPKKDPKITGQYVTAMGWGRLHKSEYLTRSQDIMKKTKLRVIDIESCSMDWSYLWDVDKPKVICTWSKRSDICVGDSGGPVVWLDPETNRYTLVGLPALCDGCVLRLPSAHTAVHLFYDWIQTVINETHPEANMCTKKD